MLVNVEAPKVDSQSIWKYGTNAYSPDFPSMMHAIVTDVATLPDSDRRHGFVTSPSKNDKMHALS